MIVRPPQFAPRFTKLFEPIRATAVEAWTFRRLFFFFALRDVRVRYKQTLIGCTWVVLQPLLEMIVLSVIFGDFFNTTSIGIPYPLFLYCGLLPWTAFSNSVMSATTSVIANADIIKRIYFPRYLVPIASAFGKILDISVAFVVLFGMMIYYRMPIGWGILALPVLLFFLFLVSAGFALFLSCLNAIYRDTALLLPYFLRIGMLLTPVIYPVRILRQPWQTIVELNPLSGFIEAMRRIVLLEQPPSLVHFLVSAVSSITFFIIGIWFFRRMEKQFLDVI